LPKQGGFLNKLARLTPVPFSRALRTDGSSFDSNLGFRDSYARVACEGRHCGKVAALALIISATRGRLVVSETLTRVQNNLSASALPAADYCRLWRRLERIMLSDQANIAQATA
jgi:hypothetical protein